MFVEWYLGNLEIKEDLCLGQARPTDSPPKPCLGAGTEDLDTQSQSVDHQYHLEAR